MSGKDKYGNETQRNDEKNISERLLDKQNERAAERIDKDRPKQK